MSFLKTFGKDFKAVFAWLGSPKGQATIASGEGLVIAGASAFGEGAPVQAAIDLINSWMTKIITTESIAAAAGVQDGSGVQKAAAVLTAIGPELAHYFPGTTAAEAKTINDALALVLNTLGSVSVTSTAPATPPAA